MLQTFIAPNSLLIECIIKSSNGNTVVSNPFGTQEQLFNRKVVAIEAFCDLDCLQSPISSGTNVIPATLFNTAYLSLYSAAASETSGLIYNQVPLCSMRRVQNQFTNAVAITPSYTRDLFRIKPTEITWSQKSFVTIGGSWPSAVTYVALFQIYYLDEGDAGQAWYPNWYPGQAPRSNMETKQTGPKSVH